MGGEFLGNEAVEFLDAGLDLVELFGKGLGEGLVDFEQGGVGAHGVGVCDELKTFFDHFGAPASLFVVEAGDGGGAGFLEVLEGGPFGEQSAGERGEEVTANELEGLWEVVFEVLGEAVGEAGAGVDELAAFFGEGGNLMGERVGNGEGLKAGVTFVKEEGQGVGVAPVVFGFGGAERFAVAFNEGGVDEVEFEEGKLGEEVDKVLARLFDTEGDVGSGGELVLEASDPG